MNDQIYSQNFAETVSEYIFSDSECNSEKYAAYAEVPVSCISILKDGRETPAVTQDVCREAKRLKIDMVLCVGKEIALCVMLTREPKLEKLFNGPLHGIPNIQPAPSYSTDPPYSTESFAAYAKAVLARYAQSKENKAVKHVITAYSVKSLCSVASDVALNDSEDANSALMRAHAVDENLKITDYGIACGIMCCYSPCPSAPHGMKKSFKASKHSPEIFSPKKYFGMEPAKGSDCRMTLKERLKCLNLMIPCNEGYGQLLAQRLKAFLNTPLSEIMYGNTTIYHQLYEDIADAEEIIRKSAENFPLKRRIVTYGDLMYFLYRMKSLIDYRYRKCYCGDLNMRFSDILIDLGNFIYSSENEFTAKRSACGNKRKATSLKEHLNSLSGKETLSESIFSMPLGYYYYAASLLLNSNYPNWLCRKQFQDERRFELEYEELLMLGKNLAYTVSDERINIFQEYDDEEFMGTEKYVSYLFDLLVMPVIDINKVKNINK